MYRFMTKGEVIAEQERQLALYGGGSPGILDAGKLDAAVELPQATFGGEYLLPDVFAIAAAYAKYLVGDHCFEQANKRIGLATAVLFLKLNGIELTADNEAATELIMAIAAEGKERDAVADFFRDNHTSVPAAALDAATEWMHARYAPAFRKLAE